MPQKYRLTGCAKFFFFLLIAGPLAYFGAYYWNTGDAMSGLRSLGIGLEKDPVVNEQEPANTDQVLDLQKEVDRLKKELEECQNKSNSENQN